MLLITLAILASTLAATPRLAVVGGCFDPAAYGAVPNDGISDRVAIQAAADAASAAPGPQTVCLGAGVWDCSKAPLTAYNRASCVSVHQGNVTFAGAGAAATTLRLSGDQGNADIVIISHDPGSAGGVRDMTIDTTGTTNTAEQTHAMGTTGICAAPYCTTIGPLSYQRLVINHPRSGTGRKGDAIRLLGNTPGTAIYGVLIEDVKFVACARSCVQPQRGVHGLVLRNSEFWADQPIHGESTGGTALLEDEDADIYGNTFHDASVTGAPFQGDYDIALSGPPGGGPYDRIRIHDNIGSRGYYLYRTSNAEVYDTVIDANMKTVGGLIEVGNRCDGVVVRNSILRRSGVAGALIRLATRDTSACHDAIIMDTTLIQDTAGHAIHAESVSGLQVERVTAVWTTPAPQHAGVWHRATASRVDGMTVHDSWFTGPVGTAVLLSAAPFPFGVTHVIDNRSRGNATGISCIGSAGITSVEYTLNKLGPVSCSAVLP